MSPAWSEFPQCTAVRGGVCGMVYLRGWVMQKGMERERYHRGSCYLIRRALGGIDCRDGYANGRVLEQERSREYRSLNRVDVRCSHLCRIQEKGTFLIRLRNCSLRPCIRSMCTKIVCKLTVTKHFVTLRPG